MEARFVSNFKNVVHWIITWKNSSLTTNNLEDIQHTFYKSEIASGSYLWKENILLKGHNLSSISKTVWCFIVEWLKGK